MLGELGELLRAAGYNQERISEAIGRTDGLLPATPDFPIYERRLRTAPAPLAGLLRLFLLGQAVPGAEARALLGSRPIDAFEFLRVDGGSITSTIQLTAVGDLILPHDFEREPVAHDHVLAPGPTARLLADHTVRATVATALDIGTGCGIQALLLAQHASRVVATDTNARAVRLAQWGCELNGITNVEFRVGSLYEPVAGEQFDVVVCNPPFVISPESAYEYRDGGLSGDSLSEAVVRGMPSHLVAGGTGHVLCNWALGPDEDRNAPPERWLRKSGCNALVLHFDVEDPLTYAARWNSSHMAEEGFGSTLDSWVDYCEGLGIDLLASGAIFLRREPGDRVLHHFASWPGQAGGEHVDRILRQLSTEDADGDSIAAGVFQPVAGLRLEQVLAYKDDGFGVGTAVFAATDGMSIRVAVAPEALHVVLQLDGETPLSTLIDETVEDLELDPDSLREAALAAVVELVGAGLLERVTAERA